MRGDAALQRARRGRIPFEFGIAAGSVAMIVVALIDSAAFSPHHTGDRLAAMAVAIVIFSIVGRWQSALPVAAVGYLLYDGFLANRYGELTWDHQTGARAIGVIALAVALGLTIGRLRSSLDRAAPTIRPSVETSWGRSGARGRRESRGTETGRLRPFRNRSAATPMSPRRSAADDRDATTNNTVINNMAID